MITALFIWVLSLDSCFRKYAAIAPFGILLATLHLWQIGDTHDLDAFKSSVEAGVLLCAVAFASWEGFLGAMRALDRLEQRVMGRLTDG